MPPISSTIRSELSRISLEVAAGERVSTPGDLGRSPVIARSGPRARASSSSNAAPTVPWPSSADPERPRRGRLDRPSVDVAGHQVLVASRGARPRARRRPAEDHRRARHAVVVVGHRVAVGAGRRASRRRRPAAGRRAARRGRSRRRTRSACRRGGSARRRRPACGRRSPPRSGSRRASAAGCPTCRRRPRPRSRRCA